MPSSSLTPSCNKCTQASEPQSKINLKLRGQRIKRLSRSMCVPSTAALVEPFRSLAADAAATERLLCKGTTARWVEAVRLTTGIRCDPRPTNGRDPTKAQDLNLGCFCCRSASEATWCAHWRHEDSFDVSLHEAFIASWPKIFLQSPTQAQNRSTKCFTKCFHKTAQQWVSQVLPHISCTESPLSHPIHVCLHPNVFMWAWFLKTHSPRISNSPCGKSKT